MAGYFCCTPFGTPAAILNSIFRGHAETCCGRGGLAACCTTAGSASLVALVTGANRGVGYHTAQILLNQGLTVYLLCRDLELGRAAARKLIAATCCAAEQVEAFHVDLGDLSTIAAFIEEVDRRKTPVVSLVNNAGTIGSQSMKINHLGHFALTLGLIPALQRGAKLHRGLCSCAGGASVVNVASVAHLQGAMTIANWSRSAAATIPEAETERVVPQQASAVSQYSCNDNDRTSLWEPQNADAWSEYSLSKAANVLFSHALARRLDLLPGYSGIRVSSYHPGVMASDLWVSGSQRDQVDGASNRECQRLCLFPCVKHPCMSAAGLAALANPRVGLRASSPSSAFCSSNSSSKLSPAAAAAAVPAPSPWYHSLCFPENGMLGLGPSASALCCAAWMGDSGGYYQQACQLCVVPVRAMPATYDDRAQDDLWVASVLAIKQRHVRLGQRLGQSLEDGVAFPLGGVAGDRPCRVSPALPCTEVITSMPYCLCLTCLF